MQVVEYHVQVVAVEAVDDVEQFHHLVLIGIRVLLLKKVVDDQVFLRQQADSVHLICAHLFQGGRGNVVLA